MVDIKPTYEDFIAKDFTGDPSSWPGSGTGAGAGYGTPIRVEDTQFINVDSEYDTNNASGGTASWVLSPSGPSAVSFAFNGPAGLYNVDIGYFDALGSADLVVKQGSTTLDSWTLDNDELLWSNNFISRNIASNIQVNPGDIFSFSGTGELLEYAIVDYLHFTPTGSGGGQTLPPPNTETVRVEAEDINTIYDIEDVSGASGGQVWSVVNGPSGETGTGTFDFIGQSDLYDVIVGYYDENDGVGEIKLEKDGVVLDQWDLDQDLGSDSPNSSTFATRTVASSIQVNAHDSFTLYGTEDSGEYARVDYFEFVPNGGSGSGGSGGSGEAPQSVLETYQDAAISHIASILGWTEQQVRDSLPNVSNSITDSRFADVATDILSGYGNGWGSSGSSGGGGGWGGGSSGSCGWGCQEFEELFYSHAFAAATTTDSDNTHDHDHSHTNEHDNAAILILGSSTNKSYWKRISAFRG